MEYSKNYSLGMNIRLLRSMSISTGSLCVLAFVYVPVKQEMEEIFFGHSTVFNVLIYHVNTFPVCLKGHNQRGMGKLPEFVSISRICLEVKERLCTFL